MVCVFMTSRNLFRTTDLGLCSAAARLEHETQSSETQAVALLKDGPQFLVSQTDSVFLILRHQSRGKDKTTQAFCKKAVGQPNDGVDDIPTLVLPLKDDCCFPSC